MPCILLRKQFHSIFLEITEKRGKLFNILIWFIAARLVTYDRIIRGFVFLHLKIQNCCFENYRNTLCPARKATTSRLESVNSSRDNVKQASKHLPFLQEKKEHFRPNVIFKLTHGKEISLIITMATD